MLSLMDYRQDCKTVFQSLLHSRSLCKRSSSIAWRHKELLCSRLDISSNSTESWSGTLNHYLNVKYLDSLIAQVRQKNCILVFSNLNRAILNIVLWRFPFKKKILVWKFPKFHLLRERYRPDSSRTDLTQATALLIIFLVSKIKKSGTGDNNLRNGKGHFGDRPKSADRWKKTTFEGGPKYSGRT